MGRLLNLPWALQLWGLPVKVVDGWETSGSDHVYAHGHLAHWTAGPQTGEMPSLRVCVLGRPGLPPPLCQDFLPRGLTLATQRVYVVSSGRANHAGRGDYRGADGNTDVTGTEVEWSGRPGELTAWQRYAWPRINAAHHTLGQTWVAGHDEYAVPRGRKIDIGGEIEWLRRETARLISIGPEAARREKFGATIIPTSTDPEELTVADISKILEQFKNLPTKTDVQQMINDRINAGVVIDLKNTAAWWKSHVTGEQMNIRLSQLLQNMDLRTQRTQRDNQIVKAVVRQLLAEQGKTAEQVAALYAAAEKEADAVVGELAAAEEADRTLPPEVA